MATFRRPILMLVLLAVVASACSVDRLPAPSTALDNLQSPPAQPSRSGAPPAATPGSDARGTDDPSAVIEPPYRLITGGGVTQDPGTILFGDLTADGLSPFLGFPHAFTIDRTWGFGAFFGRPAGTTEITLTLHRQVDGVWQVVWSDVKQIDAAATGYPAHLVAFAEPGLYRLDVTDGMNLLATALMKMEPPCVGTCTGG